MKKWMKKVAATTMAVGMVFSFIGCNTANSPTPNGEKKVAYSYMAIDINPSIELVIEGETVVSVKACNEDAAILLSGENFEGQNIEIVSQSIVELAEELGYLTTENDGVKITVSADSATLQDKLQELAEIGAKAGSKLANVNHAPRWADESKVKELQARADGEKYKNLTPAKLRLIEAIMKYDETMTYEKGANMKVSELADILEDLAEEYFDIVGDELEEKFEKAFEIAKDVAHNGMAEIYGEEYKALWDRYVALKKVVKEVEIKAEKIEISEEDLQAIFELIGVKGNNQQPTAPEGEQGGQQGKPEDEGYGGFGEMNDWNMEAFEDYFDRHFHHKFDEDKFEEIKDKIEEILDKYDGDNYKLSEEDLAAIQEAWGKKIEVTTFEALEEFLEEQEEVLDEMREEIEKELGYKDKVSLEVLKEGLNIVKETAKNNIKSAMEAKKEEWKALKEEKRK